MRKTMLGCVALVAIASVPAHASGTYTVDLSVSRQGTLVGKPTIVVDEARQAELTMTPPHASNERAVRVLVSVMPTTAANDVKVRLSIFDRLNGAWVLHAQPEVTAALNKDVTLAIDGSDTTGSSMIQIGMKVTRPSPQASTASVASARR